MIALRRVFWALSVLASLGGYVALWFSLDAALLTWLAAASLWITTGAISAVLTDPTEPWRSE